MRKIRVAHITSTDMSIRFLLLNQLLSIQEAGYDVIAICSPGAYVAEIEATGIQVIPVPMSRRIAPLSDLRSMWFLYCIFRRNRFALVHTHNLKSALPAQLAAKAAGIPVIVRTLHGFRSHEHAPLSVRRFYNTLERILASCSDVILSQNSEDIDTAIREGVFRASKIGFLGNGIDLGRFDPTSMNPEALHEKRLELKLPPDALVVGFVGRLVAEKGLLDLFAAAQIVRQRHSNVRLLIVGQIDSDKTDALTPDTTQRYGLADMCVFTGMRHDMPELYSLMDVFVFPSHREGFPRSPMEASAMGVPLVATDIRGCREIVEHGRNGLLIPIRDPSGLANAICELLADPDKRHRMGEGGRRMALERFDEQELFERVKAEYARLLTEKGLVISRP